MLDDDNLEDIIKHLTQGLDILTLNDLTRIDNFIVNLIGNKVHKKNGLL